jgi:hypothetical protein
MNGLKDKTYIGGVPVIMRVMTDDSMCLRQEVQPKYPGQQGIRID